MRRPSYSVGKQWLNILEPIHHLYSYHNRDDLELIPIIVFSYFIVLNFHIVHAESGGVLASLAKLPLLHAFPNIPEILCLV